MPVPQSYPGLTTFIEDEGLTRMIIQEGVMTQPQVVASSFAVRYDSALSDWVKPRADWSAAVSSTPQLPLTLFVRSTDASRRADTTPLDIRNLISFGQAHRARDLADEYVHARPSDPEAYLLRGEALAAAGLYYLAERDLRLAGMAGADPRRLLMLWAKLAWDRGDVEHPRQLIGEGGLERLADMYLAEAATAAVIGNSKLAFEKLESAGQLTVRQPTTIAWKVRLLSSLGKLKEAEGEARNATEKFPQDSVLWLLRAALVPTDDKARLAETLTWVDRAVKLDPKSVAALLLRAKLRVMLDPLEADAARNDVKLAHSLAPNNPEVYVVRSQISFIQGDQDGALADCAQAIRISPGYVPAYLQRFVARLLSNDRASPTTYVANLEDINTLLVLKPQDSGIRCIRADLLTNLDTEKFQELGRNPQRMKRIIAPIVIEHMDKLTILPKAAAAAANLDPKRLPKNL